MAKLSARGRTELWRVKKDMESGSTYYYAFMSDGTLLSKTKYSTGGSSTWARSRKLNLADSEQIKASMLARGYSITAR